LDKTAATVDRVLSEQVTRLVRYAETCSPGPHGVARGRDPRQRAAQPEFVLAIQYFLRYHPAGLVN
jgi:hypothetical protein